MLYSVDIINRLYKSSLFQFEYTINRVDRNNSYRLTKTCNKKDFNFIPVLNLKIKLIIYYKFVMN